MTDMPERIWASNCIDQQAWSPFDNLVAAAPYVRADLPPKVLALEWDQMSPRILEAIGCKDVILEAIGCNDVYQIRVGTDGKVRWQGRYMGQWEDADSIKAAQAVAQADYTARILAALARP